MNRLGRLTLCCLLPVPFLFAADDVTFPVGTSPFTEVLQPSATGLLLPSAEAVGVNYEICIRMTEALTDWETANGATMTYENVGTPWIEIVERCVDALI